MTDPAQGAPGRPSFADRLADPLSHFPYKRDKALQAAGDDPAHVAEVEATDAYVAAQRAYFEHPTEETRADERQAAQALQDVRRDRRTLRDAPALIAAIEAQIQAADTAEDGPALEAAEALLEQTIERVRAAAARFGIDLEPDGDEQQEG